MTVEEQQNSVEAHDQKAKDGRTVKRFKPNKKQVYIQHFFYCNCHYFFISKTNNV